MHAVVCDAKPSELFKQFINENVLSTIGECIIKGYSESYLYCYGNFSPKQAHDLLPYHRRSKIEQNIIKDLKTHNEVNVETCSNIGGNSFHVKIVGGHASATISAVDNPSSKARKALFRDQYAVDNEYTLFPEIYEELELDHNIYGIILHGPDFVNPSTPGFINLMFPKGGNYLAETIDILELVKNTHKKASVIEEPNPEPDDDVRIYVRKKEA